MHCLHILPKPWYLCGMGEDRYHTIKLHREDVARIQEALDGTPNGMSFVVWGKAMSQLSSKEIYELSIKFGRRRIREMEDRIRDLEEKKK